jgi:hypothetical protein
MVFGANFNNISVISWHSVLLAEEIMIVGFTTACAICAYHHYSCEFEPRSWRGVLDTTLRDKVRQLFATGRVFTITFNDISVISRRSDSLLGETGVCGKKTHQLAASH